MILFLNFAPLTFGGGAERWMIDVASEVSKFEKVFLVDVQQKIADVYGKLILKRKYDTRIKLNLATKKETHLTLRFASFIPFTKKWKQARQAFSGMRKIYIRFEILETFILLYFGGFSSLKKTVAGIHSPFLYAAPRGFFENLHNTLYGSSLTKWFLSQMHTIHVISPVNYELFTKNLALKNVLYVPNYIAMENAMSIDGQKDAQLSIGFVGELNMRKGVDVMIETVKKSPLRFIFHIAGDGVMKKDVEKLLCLPNVVYHGFLKKKEIQNIYAKSDILFFPSRAEGFSLACLEAMSNGLVIVSSKNTYLGLPPDIQQMTKNGSPDEYIDVFEKIEKIKHRGRLYKQKKEIQEYTKKNFSKDIVMKKLIDEIFEIKN